MQKNMSLIPNNTNKTRIITVNVRSHSTNFFYYVVWDFYTVTKSQILLCLIRCPSIQKKTDLVFDQPFVVICLGLFNQCFIQTIVGTGSPSATATLTYFFDRITEGPFTCFCVRM